MAAPRVITFDVYGTLTRWDETVAAVIGELLVAHGRPGADVPLAADAFEAESRRLQTVGAFRSYRDILQQSLVPALATAGLRPDDRDPAVLLERLSRVPAFPEVPSVLRALSTNHRLAPISNTDDDLVSGTLDQFGDVFMAVVTAQQARAYKPNPGLFRFALRKLRADIQDIIHVAQGTFSDLAVCSALGIRTIWINRTGTTLQDGLEPSAILPDLSDLADVVSRLGS